MSFETNGTVGRVTILLGDNDKTEQLQNANYYGTINSYAIQEGIGMEYASDVAGNIYTYITGNDVDDDKEYTIISTLDERHKTGDYQYYMYYDNGNLMAKPIIYSGDTAYVATCDRGTGYNTQKILDFTEYLDSPVYVASNEELLNKAMTNQE
ncbi:MAG: hypothetical protein K6B67_01810 [Lachnospiraceae bacterium]|nr:hypothetical protein [Lachnospiraceae bacterium]